MISKNLYTFLKEWWVWAESGAGKHEIFYRHCGLCSRYKYWLRNYKNDPSDEDELDVIFKGREFPFGKDNYFSRYYDATQHLCPKRLAWVRQKIKQYEEVNG